MQTKEICVRLKNRTLVSASSIGRSVYQLRLSLLFFSFRQLCLYISDLLHFFTLFLTESLNKCQTKSFKNMNTLLSSIFKICTTNQFRILVLSLNC